jgi:hypothetical protein
MAFLIKLGTMTIVVPTASEAVNTFDKFVADSQRVKPIIWTFDGTTIDIERLRGLVEDAGSKRIGL